MAVKTKVVYVCSECGCESAKWNGKCIDCGAWNSFVEETRQFGGAASKSQPMLKSLQDIKISSLDEIDANEEQRLSTGLAEFDRVLGGGIVKGSVSLIGGEPGIGKSTILLQICEHLGRDKKILYVSGEESEYQLKLRAVRLGVNSQNLFLTTITDAELIAASIEQLKPDVLIVDSIQTVTHPSVSSSPGSVSQVRESASAISRAAKANGVPCFIVGHVNKEGSIAGPKVIEHIVDTVLYFEGEKNQTYRILRAIKNRYGSTNELGIFEMLSSGLKEVENPSLMLLEGRPEGASGTCVACVIEGTRPMFVEVQALVSKSAFAAPRRMAAGFDYNRMSLLLAVLEKRAGFFLGNLDIYINVVGGLKLTEPSADLPVLLAVASALTDKVVDSTLVAFGEIGLAGEIRPGIRAMTKLTEASRLGFEKCLLPKSDCSKLQKGSVDISLIGAASISQAIKLVLG